MQAQKQNRRRYLYTVLDGYEAVTSRFLKNLCDNLGLRLGILHWVPSTAAVLENTKTIRVLYSPNRWLYTYHHSKNLPKVVPRPALFTSVQQLKLDQAGLSVSGVCSGKVTDLLMAFRIIYGVFVSFRRFAHKIAK